MRLHAVQLDLAWEDPAANYRLAHGVLDDHEVDAGDLVVLPEMFPTGFSLDLRVTCEGEGRPTESFFRDLARARGCFVLGGQVTRGPDGRARNEAVALDPDGAPIGRYTKLFPFTYGGESAIHAAGDRVATFDWRGCTVAPLICYDLRFPEAARLAIRRGAQMLIYIASWPAPRTGHWTALLRARAIENLCYVAGINRTGADPNHRYEGATAVFDPQGETLADDGGRGEQGVIAAEIDLQEVLAWRNRFPALDDMRDDLGLEA